MAKKGGLGLGRGLDALMGGGASNTPLSGLGSAKDIKKDEEGKPVNLPEGVNVDDDGTLWANPADFVANPKQPRTEFDQKKLEELADSIRENGIIEPIIIEPAGDGKFYIIAGERRTRASLLAGLTKVPVQIRKFDEIQRLQVALIENIQRADLNPIDEAQAYYNLMELGELTHEEVAKRVGKNRSTVTNSVRLLKLPDDMKKSLIDGQITSGHARALLSVTNPADQRIMFGKIIGSGLNVREAEELAQLYNNGGRAASSKPAKKAVKKDPEIARIEQKFIDVFGTKVTLKGTLEKGSIEINYFTKEDLNRLYNIIAPGQE